MFAGEEAWIVGGAVRDRALGRPVVDVDVALAEPEKAARRFARESGGAPFPLSERHGAWRVAFDDSRTVDFTPLRGPIEDDLATRDFSINAIAERAASDETVDPYAGYADLAARRLRAIGDEVFRDDPLRLLRGPRLEDELDRDDLANKRGQREGQCARAGARVERALVASEGQEVAHLNGQLAGSALLQRRDPISRRREPGARCVVRTQAPPPWT